MSICKFYMKKKKTPKLKILKKIFISDVHSSPCQQNYVSNLHAYCLNRKGTFEIKKIFFTAIN